MNKDFAIVDEEGKPAVYVIEGKLILVEGYEIKEGVGDEVAEAVKED